jgi:hypothetical protein
VDTETVICESHHPPRQKVQYRGSLATVTVTASTAAFRGDDSLIENQPLIGGEIYPNDPGFRQDVNRDLAPEL